MGYTHLNRHVGIRSTREPLLAPPRHFLNNMGRQYRLGVTYAQNNGGLLPQNQFWRYAQYRHDLNPARFNQRHPRLASLLDRAASLRREQEAISPPVGLLPQTPYWDYLRYRHDVNPERFNVYHPQLGPLLDQDKLYRDTHPVVVPEPGSSLLLAIGLISVGCWRKWKGFKV